MPEAVLWIRIRISLGKPDPVPHQSVSRIRIQAKPDPHHSYVFRSCGGTNWSHGGPWTLAMETLWVKWSHGGPWLLAMEPRRAVGARNGDVDGQNGVMEGRGR